MWSAGLIFAIILAFLTNGRLWLIIPGGFIVHHIAGHRLGWYRYDINYWGIALIAIFGNIATILFIILLKGFSVIISSDIIIKLILFNIIYTAFNMLPIPTLDGGKIFYGSRLLYAFILPGIIGAIILLYADIPVWLSIIGALAIGFVLCTLYYIFLEKDLW